MPARLAIVMALALGVALAAPLATAAWLTGGHVTLEQGLLHAQAVALDGYHEHGGRDLAPQVVATTDPVLTIPTIAPSSFYWQALALALVAHAALTSARWLRRAPARRPAAHRTDVPCPPPRPRRALPAA